MTRWLCALLLTLSVPVTSIAWEMPYGVQDPMLRSPGFMPCDGHEIGYWNVLTRETPDKRRAIYLVLTTVDLLDPALVICVVRPDMKVMAIGPEKKP